MRIWVNGSLGRTEQGRFTKFNKFAFNNFVSLCIAVKGFPSLTTVGHTAPGEAEPKAEPAPGEAELRFTSLYLRAFQISSENVIQLLQSLVL
jgi:hypothetical protein